MDEKNERHIYNGEFQSNEKVEKVFSFLINQNEKLKNFNFKLTMPQNNIDQSLSLLSLRDARLFYYLIILFIIISIVKTSFIIYLFYYLFAVVFTIYILH